MNEILPFSEPFLSIQFDAIRKVNATILSIAFAESILCRSRISQNVDVEEKSAVSWLPNKNVRILNLNDFLAKMRNRFAYLWL